MDTGQSGIASCLSLFCYAGDMNIKPTKIFGDCPDCLRQKSDQRNYHVRCLHISEKPGNSLSTELPKNQFRDRDIALISFWKRFFRFFSVSDPPRGRPAGGGGVHRITRFFRVVIMSPEQKSEQKKKGCS